SLIRRPPPASPLFPYTTLFRSRIEPGPRREQVTLELDRVAVRVVAVQVEAEVVAFAQGAIGRRDQHGRLIGWGDGERHQARDIVDRKSTRLNSSHLGISYAVFC